MMSLKVMIAALAFVAAVNAASIDTADLKMAEAEDTDSALEWTRHRLKKWGGDYKKILKGMPPLSMKDDGVSLAGARDLLGNKVKGDMMNDKELQMLAKAENRLAAAKQDVHEAQTATSGIKRAQLEDLAQELTEEAQHHLEETKEVD